MRRLSSIIAIVILSVVPACNAADNPARGSEGNANNSNNGAQAAPDRGKSDLQLDGGTVSVEYGRPALKGRDLEKMITPGQEWRMGSNAATTLTSSVDLKFGDKVLPKGKYILKAKSSEPERWSMIVLTEDQSPVMEAPLTFTRTADSAELLTIDLAGKDSGGTFTLRWGTLSLSTDLRKA